MVQVRSGRIYEFDDFQLHADEQFIWSFDGKDLAYTIGESTREIILIENFR